MNSWIKILSAALIMQIALAALLISGKDNLGSFRSDDPLIGVDLAAINKITVEEKDKPALALELSNGAWVLASKKEIPLSAEKVNLITQNLLTLKKSYPVGKTTLAAKQFKVVDGEFERKITLGKDANVLKTIFIGSAPTFRKVHARLDGEDYTYEVSYAAHDLSTKEADWYDREILNVDQSKLTKITYGPLTLLQNDSKFTLEGLKEGEEANAAEISSFVSKLTRIAYEDIYSEDQVKSVKDGAPALEYTLETKDNEKITYIAYGPLEEQFYALLSSKFPYYFKVRKAAFESIKDLSREKLLQAKPPAQAESTPVTAADAAAPAAQAITSQTPAAQ